ncbi:MAG: hypothetical protein KDB03_05620 [Planctomycetales bacterium]|nr:hypothetical protein [Planctomycetales bacterium]
MSIAQLLVDRKEVWWIEVARSENSLCHQFSVFDGREKKLSIEMDGQFRRHGVMQANCKH